MRKQFLLVALIAVLATMATGCQKENFVELQSTFAETGAVRTVNYTLDGTLHQLNPQNLVRETGFKKIGGARAARVLAPSFFIRHCRFHTFSD